MSSSADASRAGRLSPEQRRMLLSLAREAIARHLEAGEAPPAAAGPDVGPHGLFVTLRQGGELRGCIGWPETGEPLGSGTARCAIAAATRDPRFAPLSLEELPRTHIEISVLSLPETVRDVEEIVAGRDGLIVEHGSRRGLLLPQVATEQGWDRLAFLEATCRKAGLRPTAWKEGVAIYRFTAEVFSEE